VGGQDVVGRTDTIAWTNFFRRIVKDYEYTVKSSETWILLANISIICSRLKPSSE
jgi:hypothetical protein